MFPCDTMIILFDIDLSRVRTLQVIPRYFSLEYGQIVLLLSMLTIWIEVNLRFSLQYCQNMNYLTIRKRTAQI